MNTLKKIVRRVFPGSVTGVRQVSKSDAQSLDVYWTEEMAKSLEEWGADSTWNEIQMTMSVCNGKVLDIACGTGKTIEILSKFPLIEVHGCDISEFLIHKAVERGIPADRLKVCDATATGYTDEKFEYSYSIGSLEHFTEDGIHKFIAESHRITKKGSFHMVPVSRNGKDTGWITTIQSYFNNSEQWWLEKFKKHYDQVYAVPSKWEDDLSLGRWFLCFKAVI